MHVPRRALPLLFLLLTALLLGFISLRLLKASVTPSPSPANFIRSHLGLAPMQCPTVTHKILFWNDLTKARLTYDPVFDVLQDGVITVSDAIVLNTAMLQVMIDCNEGLCNHREQFMTLADTNADEILSNAEAEALLVIIETWLNADVPDPTTIADMDCNGTKNDADIAELLRQLSILLP